MKFQKRCVHTVSIILSFHTMWHVWIRAVQDDDHLSQGFFHSYVRTFFCSQLCLHFLLSHSVLDCPSYRYFLWFFCFHFVNSSHIFGSSWERLLGHVCHTTDKQADAAPKIFPCYFHAIPQNIWMFPGSTDHLHEVLSLWRWPMVATQLSEAWEHLKDLRTEIRWRKLGIQLGIFQKIWWYMGIYMGICGYVCMYVGR